MHYSWIVFIFVTVSLLGSESQNITCKTIEKALAIHERDSIQNWNAIMADVAKELSQNLRPSTSGNTVSEALMVLIDSPGLSISQIPKVRENDWKELYLVKENGTPRYVLKLYKTDSSLFPSDFWGQWCASHLFLSHTVIAQVKDAGKITVNNTEYFFLLEEFIEGTSFDHVRTTDAFKQLGVSLKEFHQVSTNGQAPLSYPFRSSLNATISKGITLLDEKDRDWVSPLYVQLKANIESKSLPRSYVHGDPNFANFLLQKKRVGIIDFEAAGQYMNANCQGIGTPLYDLVTLLDYLEGLSEPALKSSFLDGYGPLPYDEDTMLYFRLYDTMNAIEWLEGAQGQMTPERITHVKKKIRLKLNQLQKSAPALMSETL